MHCLLHACLAALPDRNSLFKEGCGAFGHVGSSGESGEERGLAGEGGGERQVEALVDGAEGGGDGERGVDGDFVGEGLGARQEFSCGNHFVHEADAQCRLGVDLDAGQQEAESGGAANESGEALGATVTGDDA